MEPDEGNQLVELSYAQKRGNFQRLLLFFNVQSSSTYIFTYNLSLKILRQRRNCEKDQLDPFCFWEVNEELCHIIRNEFFFDIFKRQPLKGTLHTPTGTTKTP